MGDLRDHLLVERLGGDDEQPPIGGVDRHRDDFETPGVLLGEAGRCLGIGRLGAQVGERDAELFGKSRHQLVLVDGPLLEQEIAQPTALVALAGQDRDELVTGDDLAGHQHTSERRPIGVLPLVGLERVTGAVEDRRGAAVTLGATGRVRLAAGPAR